jgi:hypothetical protein
MKHLLLHIYNIADWRIKQCDNSIYWKQGLKYRVKSCCCQYDPNTYQHQFLELRSDITLSFFCIYFGNCISALKQPCCIQPSAIGNTIQAKTFFPYLMMLSRFYMLHSIKWDNDYEWWIGKDVILIRALQHPFIWLEEEGKTSQKLVSRQLAAQLQTWGLLIVNWKCIQQQNSVQTSRQAFWLSNMAQAVSLPTSIQEVTGLNLICETTNLTGIPSGFP